MKTFFQVREAKKIKGADGKACWDGYRYAGTENNKDKCVKVSEDNRDMCNVCGQTPCNCTSVSEESELGDLAKQKKMKHRFLVTYSDPNHTMVSKRKEKMQMHVKAPATDKEGRSVFKGDAEPLVKKHMKNKGYKVHEIQHVGLVSEGYWKDALKKAEADREARKGKPFKNNPLSHDENGVYIGDKDLGGNPVPKEKKQGVAEGIEELNHWHEAGVRDASRGMKPNPRTYLPTMTDKKAKHPEEILHYMTGYKSVKNNVKEQVAEGKRGLWDNIHAKRERIKNGSGEHMRKPGSKGAPTAQAFIDSAKTSKNEEVEQIAEVIDHYADAEKHLSLANDYDKKGNLGAYHAHMTQHHESLSKWHESKGRSSAADRHEEKAEQHHMKSLEHTYVKEAWHSGSGVHPMNYRSAYSRGKEWDEGGQDDDKHPHSVHINGKHWKTFSGRIHAARAAETFNSKNPNKKATVVRESIDEGIARLISNSIKKVTATKPTPKQKAEIRMNKEATDPLGGDYQASVLNLQKKAKEQEQKKGPVDLNKLRQRLAAVGTDKKQTEKP